MSDFDNKDFEEELQGDAAAKTEEEERAEEEGKQGKKEENRKGADSSAGTSEGSGESGKKESEYEDVCFICRRPESRTGKMFRLPNNISVCNDWSATLSGCPSETDSDVNK